MLFVGLISIPFFRQKLSLYFTEELGSDGSVVIGLSMRMIQSYCNTYLQSSELQTLIDYVTTLCDHNSLIVNSTKTKEVLFQNQRNDKNTKPVTIDVMQGHLTQALCDGYTHQEHS